MEQNQPSQKQIQEVEDSISKLRILIQLEIEKQNKVKIYNLIKHQLKNITNKNVALKIANNYVKSKQCQYPLLEFDYQKPSELLKLITTNKQAFIYWNFLVLREMYQKNFCSECKENLKSIWENTLQTKQNFYQGFQNDKAEFAYTFHDDYTEAGMDYDGGGEFFSGVTYYGRCYNFRVGLHIDQWYNHDQDDLFGNQNEHFDEQMKKKFKIKNTQFPEKVQSVQCKAVDDEDMLEDYGERDENGNIIIYHCPDYLNEANQVIMQVYHQKAY